MPKQAIFRSPFSTPDATPGSVTDYALRHVDRLGDKAAIVDAQSGATYSFSELRRAVRSLSSGLSRLGLERGAVVGVLAPNVIEYPVIFHGVAHGGRTLTTLNPLYTSEEIRTQLLASHARALFTVPALLEKARDAVQGTKVDTLCVIGLDADTDGVVAFSTLVNGAEEGEPEAVDPHNDVVALPYSSGTTGLPKGVMLTHRNLVANMEAVNEVVPLREDDVVLAVLPFFHIYGLNVIMNPALAAGATMVVMQRFDLELYLAAVESHRVTTLFAAPPMVLAIAQAPQLERYDLSSVRWLMSSAAPLDPSTAVKAQERLGCTVFQAYGMTEASPGVFANRPETPGPTESVGRLLPGLECRVVDPASGADLDIGDDGEILIRGAQIMRGYLNNPEATRTAIDADGFYHSGDIGHVDHEGYWYIVDRVKELIKYKGYQVAPAELEAVLLSHPDILDAAVVGVAAGDDGEIPKAFVVPRTDVAPDEIMDYVAMRVAPFKRVRDVEFLAEIPRSATGKILRRLLRDRKSL